MEHVAQQVLCKWQDVPRRADERPAFGRLDTMVQQLLLLARTFDHGAQFILTGSGTPGSTNTVKRTEEHIVALLRSIQETCKSLAARPSVAYAAEGLTAIVRLIDDLSPFPAFQPAQIELTPGGAATDDVALLCVRPPGEEANASRPASTLLVARLVDGGVELPAGAATLPTVFLTDFFQ